MPPELVEAITDQVIERLAERGQVPDPDQGGWLRGAERIAAYIDAPASRSMRWSAPGASQSGATGPP